MQSALRESVYIAPVIADQFWYMSSFDMLTYVSREVIFAASDMTPFPHTDPFILLRDSLLTFVRLGLNDDVLEDTESLNRISHLDASFNDIPNKFRRFLITHYSVFRGCIQEWAEANDDHKNNFLRLPQLDQIHSSSSKLQAPRTQGIISYA